MDLKQSLSKAKADEKSIRKNIQVLLLRSNKCKVECDKDIEIKEHQKRKVLKKKENLQQKKINLELRINVLITRLHLLDGELDDVDRSIASVRTKTSGLLDDLEGNILLANSELKENLSYQREIWGVISPGRLRSGYRRAIVGKIFFYLIFVLFACMITAPFYGVFAMVSGLVTGVFVMYKIYKNRR